ncbi:MAG: retroviral-like aspartic protease family protein [Bacteroidetes bacterium]|nr:retroviral-like aspartic protease family protein [Bacteroidota bacterium]MBU1421592.1 retroviral-like aspartic protease family protein [Bacteroidota bacterium]MBU2471014.1 retroviral-like aspartic protease family protein [Bacteroidota bacterium]MBU2636314.1 retroviral-like aspartic protease family protein [Bacteroidota bacterium]
MKFQQQPVFGLTTRYNGIANVLKNEIRVSEAYHPSSGLPEPLIKPFNCIWDTGATNTVINPSVVIALNLKPSGRTIVQAVGDGGKVNEYETNTYLVNIYLPNNVNVVGVVVSEGGIGGADVLIGMDIITSGDLAITNYNGKTCMTFRYPSVEEIDFVQEISEHNKRYGGALQSTDERRKTRNKRKAEKRKK